MILVTVILQTLEGRRVSLFYF